MADRLGQITYLESRQISNVSAPTAKGCDAPQGPTSHYSHSRGRPEAPERTHPEVGRGEAVRGGRGGCGGGRGVSEIGVDVGEQVAHDGRHTGTHVLGRQAGEVPAGGDERRQG